MKLSKYNLVTQDNGTFFVCNTYTGAVFKIDEATANFISNEQIEKLSSDDIQQFIKQGIVIEDDWDEFGILLYQHNLRKFHPNILSLTILLTSDCNFRCTYCFEGLEKEQIYLSDDIKQGIHEFILQNTTHNPNITHIALTLFGGEPLMKFERNFDFLRSIKAIYEDRQLTFSTTLVTNGSLINDARLDMLHELNCTMIQITLDGVPEIHNSRRVGINGAKTFDAVVSGIKKVVKHPNLSNPVIRINIDRTNLDSTFELLEYLKEQSLNCCCKELVLKAWRNTA